MQKKDFELLVKKGIDAIPKEFLEKLDNVEIVIEDDPTVEQLKKLKIKNNSLIFGLYEGVPKTKRWGYAQILPDKITIFKNQIEKSCQDENKIKEIVKDTVWHEIAHHFGMDEQRVRKAECQRKKIKNK
ncbi:MAG: metallopeptidase family protein [Candidatus Paceibacterota bacterium]